MIQFSHSAKLLAVAKRVNWFEPPDFVLDHPYHFMAHVMTYGTAEDIEAVKEVATDADFKEALEHAPPGIIDKRSWAYWNIMCGFDPPLPMPVRDFGQFDEAGMKAFAESLSKD